MSKYKFLVLPSCQKNMQELKHYIADVLCNPSAGGVPPLSIRN